MTTGCTSSKINTARSHVDQGKGPEYLDYNIKGRGFWERMPYNAGALYITGERGKHRGLRRGHELR